jgi:Zn-dependent protease with chaperone function
MKSVFLDFKELLTYRTKRIVSIILIIFGIFSTEVFFLPLTLRMAYAYIFIGLTLIPILSMVNMITGSIETMARVALYNRKHKPRVEVWQEVKEMMEKMGIKHSGDVFITDNPAVRNNAFVNLYTKRITISESWVSKHIHRTEALATIGHELGHLKRQKRFVGEMVAVMLGAIGFVFLFSIVALSFGLPVIPIFVQITTITLMFLLLSLVLWRNEYAADMEGAKATSPEAMISVLEVIQGNKRKANKKDYGSETHPPLHSRIERLKRLLD